jgi:hypothetical protein
MIFRKRPAPPPPPELVGEAEGERGIVIARRMTGDHALPDDRGMVLLSPARLCRHLVVCGATGSGKTETLLRLAWTLARASDAQVFYIDGKGDRRNAERFLALMAHAGRNARVFPNQPVDGWRGAAHEVQGRLMEIVDYADEGPAAWYRDIAKNVLRLVCEHPDGPPRSSGEALARMDLPVLRRAHDGDSAVSALKPEQVGQVRLRYAAFFGQSRGVLDGSWSWDEESCAYLLLDSLALREETRGLARYLLEDFAHYFTTRKPRERLCLLIVDEFSSLADAGEMATRVEQARGFNTGVVLAPQVLAGMGEESQAKRITGCVETVICHRLNDPEEVVKLGGTRLRIAHTTHYTRGGNTGEGSARYEHQYKVDPNEVRALSTGCAFVISRGRAMKVQMMRGPEIREELPRVERRPKEDNRVPLEQPPSEELQGLPF